MNRLFLSSGILYMTNRLFCHLLYSVNNRLLDHIFHIGDRTYQLLLFIALLSKGIRKADRNFIILLVAFSIIELLYYIAYAVKLIPFISDEISFFVIGLELILITFFYIVQHWK